MEGTTMIGINDSLKCTVEVSDFIITYSVALQIVMFAASLFEMPLKFKTATSCSFNLVIMVSLLVNYEIKFLQELPKLKSDYSDRGLQVENIFSIITTIIAPIGIILNTLNIVITVARPFKGSLYVYLIALSVVDGLYCLTVLPTRAFRCGSECVNVTVEARMYEKFIYVPLGNTFATTDIFITVFWAVHRLSMIYKPKTVADSNLVPLIAVIVSAIAAFSLHAIMFLEWKVVDGVMKKTTFNRGDADLYYKTALILVTKVIPILILLVTSAALVRTINKAVQRRKRLIFRHTMQAKNMYNQNRINIILISVICVMIVGNTPVTLSHTEFAEKMFGLKGRCLLANRGYLIFRSMANTLAQLAFSGNFFIYYTMNRHFQDWIQELVDRCFSRKCRQKMRIKPQKEVAKQRIKEEECRVTSVVGSKVDL